MSTSPQSSGSLHRLRMSLGHWSSAQLAALSVFLIAVIGFADYLTGYELSFGLFYVAPVSILTWFGTRKSGILGAGISAVTWLAANSLTAPPEISPVVIVWNTMIRFGFFAVIASLLATLHASHVREKELARIDPLTGLMNGRAFREAASRELMQARRGSRSLTVLYLDLDNFKSVNDRRGHAAGDALLLALGRILEGAVRATDLVCRMGGDEFVVLLPDTPVESSLVVAANIRDAVANDERFSRDGITVSIGAATATDDLADIGDLLVAADNAMYEAKRASAALAIRSDRSGVEA